jgi:hypothetical protein
VAHWIGLVNGFSNPVSKINKVEIYILNGSVKEKIYPWSYIYDQGSKGVKNMNLTNPAAVPPWALVDQEGYYMLLAAQPPPVITGNGANRKKSLQLLQQFAHSLDEEKQAYQDCNMYPICLADYNGVCV